MGKKIISAYPNAADRDAFPVEKINLKSHTIHPVFSEKTKKLHILYRRVRKIREENIDFLDLEISFSI